MAVGRRRQRLAEARCTASAGGGTERAVPKRHRSWLADPRQGLTTRQASLRVAPREEPRSGAGPRASAPSRQAKRVGSRTTGSRATRGGATARPDRATRAELDFHHARLSRARRRGRREARTGRPARADQARIERRPRRCGSPPPNRPGACCRERSVPWANRPGQGSARRLGTCRTVRSRPRVAAAEPGAGGRGETGRRRSPGRRTGTGAELGPRQYARPVARRPANGSTNPAEETAGSGGPVRPEDGWLPGRPGRGRPSTGPTAGVRTARSATPRGSRRSGHPRPRRERRWAAARARRCRTRPTRVDRSLHQSEEPRPARRGGREGRVEERSGSGRGSRSGARARTVRSFRESTRDRRACCRPGLSVGAARSPLDGTSRRRTGRSSPVRRPIPPRSAGAGRSSPRAGRQRESSGRRSLGAPGEVQAKKIQPTSAKIGSRITPDQSM